MPRIEPVPEDQVPSDLLSRMNELLATGKLGSGTTTFPRILMHHPNPEVLQHHLSIIAANGTDAGGTLGHRLRELLRLSNAQLVGCDACSEARYDGDVSEDDVSCVLVGSDKELDDRERLALQFQRQMHTDHWSIDDETFRELGTVFSTAEVVELSIFVSEMMGSGRWLHTLDMLRTDDPVLAWDHQPEAAAKAVVS